MSEREDGWMGIFGKPTAKINKRAIALDDPN